jgi:hypothetical protein
MQFLDQVWKTVQYVSIGLEVRGFWLSLPRKVLKMLSTCMYILIDALDECDEPKVLLDKLFKLVLDNQARVLLSTRIASHLPGNTTILRIPREMTQKDMRCHIRAQMTQLEVPFAVAEEFKSKVKNLLVGKSEGMYALF